jgi:hypothetical protein
MKNNPNIEAFDEFGFILWYYLPVAYHQYLEGNLKSTASKIGSGPVFYFSPNHTEVNKHFDPPLLHHYLTTEHKNVCYGLNSPKFTNDKWTPPPLKEFYKNDKYKYDKPILTIHNKNTKEWGRHPHNYFNSEILEKMFITFENDYQIIYIRPPDKSDDYKLQIDTGQGTLDIGDKEVLKRHPSVINIETLLHETDKTYNEVQFMVLANSEHHLTPAGDAVIPSYFGGDVFIYNCPRCISASRGVWKTGSWMEKLSGSKIYGFNNYNQLLINSKDKWL